MIDINRSTRMASHHALRIAAYALAAVVAVVPQLLLGAERRPVRAAADHKRHPAFAGECAFRPRISRRAAGAD